MSVVGLVPVVKGQMGSEGVALLFMQTDLKLRTNCGWHVTLLQEGGGGDSQSFKARESARVFYKTPSAAVLPSFLPKLHQERWTTMGLWQQPTWPRASLGKPVHGISSI